MMKVNDFIKSLAFDQLAPPREVRILVWKYTHKREEEGTECTSVPCFSFLVII